MIKLENINKYYNKGKDNELHVINDISLTLPETGLVTFLGQSGSGKTTLLNVVGGLDRATGTLTYDDLVIKNYKMKDIDKFRREKIGYVFQNYNLLLNETVYDNLVLALEMINIYDKEEQEKRIEYVLKQVGMFKYRKKKAYALSGGQQQRVSIARSLVKDSKIIIADEPTGNLDKDNTIQVMNILKKISKTTLVLLVTHNEEIANFYSDLVYIIKDGKIEDNYNVSSDTTLNNKESNVVYLKDLEKNTDDSNLATITYFSEKEAKKLNLEIIEHNGTFYIKSDANIKLLETSNLKIKNDHFKELKIEDVDSFNYDTTFFNNEKGKRNVLKETNLYLKQAWHNIGEVKRKTKFLYISFFVIGILFAIAVCAFSNFTVVDTKDFQIDENYYTVSSDDYFSSIEEQESINKALNNDTINNLNRIIYLSLDYKDIINYSEKVELEYSIPVISTLNKQYKLVEGELPLANEVMLSKGLAKQMVRESKNKFTEISDLIGKTMTISKGYYENERVVKISGINNNPYIMAYLPDTLYLHYVSEHEFNVIPNQIIRDYEVEHKYNTYEIIKGRDLNITDLSLKNILIPYNYPNSESLLGTTKKIEDEDYTIVGIYKMKEFKTFPNEYITNDGSSISNVDLSFKSIYGYNNYKVVEGKNPSSNDEALVSVYSKYNIGDDYNGFKIVGKYISSKENLQSILISRDSFVCTSEIYSKCIFDVLNMETLQANLKSKYEIKKTYDDIYDARRTEQNISLAIFGSFALILLIILVIFIYFLMRSRMISEIYPIGVYRSLGASKGRIYNKFICDILVVTTFTSVIGYFIFMILYGTIANTANSLVQELNLINSIPMTLLGIVGLYLITLIFGLLPVCTLLRKTPAEILSKYDI